MPMARPVSAGTGASAATVSDVPADGHGSGRAPVAGREIPCPQQRGRRARACGQRAPCLHGACRAGVRPAGTAASG